MRIHEFFRFLKGFISFVDKQGVESFNAMGDSIKRSFLKRARIYIDSCHPYYTLLSILSGEIPWSVPALLLERTKILLDTLKDSRDYLEGVLVSIMKRKLGDKLSEEDYDWLMKDPVDFVENYESLPPDYDIDAVYCALVNTREHIFALEDLLQELQKAKYLEILNNFYKLTEQKEGIFCIGFIAGNISCTCYDYCKEYFEIRFTYVDVFKKGKIYIPCALGDTYKFFDETNPFYNLKAFLEEANFRTIFKHIYASKPYVLALVIGKYPNA